VNLLGNTSDDVCYTLHIAHKVNGDAVLLAERLDDKCLFVGPAFLDELRALRTSRERA
jgi:hypothetical protein